MGFGSSVAVSCGVGHRPGSDLALLWRWCRLWHRLAARALIRPLAWEPPYAAGTALKKKTKKEKKKEKENKSFPACLFQYGHGFKVLHVDTLERDLIVSAF